MSMTCRLAAVSEEELDEVREDADAAFAALIDAEEEGDDERMLDLDRAWHAIHYLLNDSAHEGEGAAGMVIFGGATIGEGADADEEEDDYGEPPPVVRYLTPSQVEEVAALLADTSVEALQERYDPDAMEQAEIYPPGVWEEERQEAFDYVAEYYEMLVGFYELAAERGDAMLIAIG